MAQQLAKKGVKDQVGRCLAISSLSGTRTETVTNVREGILALQPRSPGLQETFGYTVMGD